jgi:hypothetical protein
MSLERSSHQCSNLYYIRSINPSGHFWQLTVLSFMRISEALKASDALREDWCCFWLPLAYCLPNTPQETIIYVVPEAPGNYRTKTVRIQAELSNG